MSRLSDPVSLMLVQLITSHGIMTIGLSSVISYWHRFVSRTGEYIRVVEKVTVGRVRRKVAAAPPTGQQLCDHARSTSNLQLIILNQGTIAATLEWRTRNAPIYRSFYRPATIQRRLLFSEYMNPPPAVTNVLEIWRYAPSSLSQAAAKMPAP